MSFVFSNTQPTRIQIKFRQKFKYVLCCVSPNRFQYQTNYYLYHYHTGHISHGSSIAPLNPNSTKKTIKTNVKHTILSQLRINGLYIQSIKTVHGVRFCVVARKVFGWMTPYVACMVRGGVWTTCNSNKYVYPSIGVF